GSPEPAGTIDQGPESTAHRSRGRQGRERTLRYRDSLGGVRRIEPAATPSRCLCGPGRTPRNGHTRPSNFRSFPAGAASLIAPLPFNFQEYRFMKISSCLTRHGIPFLAATAAGMCLLATAGHAEPVKTVNGTPIDSTVL